MLTSSRVVRALTAISLVAALPVLAAGPAAAASASVTNGADSGPGSFRAAVDAANADSDMDTIRFESDLVVELASEVRFTGPQDLVIDGKGSTLSGANAPVDTDTWDSGLFVATGGGDLAVTRLEVADSFNNGLAVFVPAGADDVEISLDRVTVTGSQFHGVLVDGQATTGYNTDDVIHPGCTDPHPVDAGATIDLHADRTVITGSGQLAGGYDITLATGCPQDFDGLRVDQGGAGDIVGSIDRSNFDANLADGAELDGKGDGGVYVRVDRSTFIGNGETEEVECTTGVGCDVGDMLVDLDDGFDIDEEDDGDLVASVSRTTVSGNFDEGLDFDETGNGDIIAAVDRVVAVGNGDEAFKASEEDDGSVVVSIDRSSFVDGGDDGTQIEEEDAGDVAVTVTRSTVTGNSENALNVSQDDVGAGSLTVDRSDLRENGDDAIDTDGIATIMVTRTQGV